ncbi:LOW QUALITY PROTEIN: hypothetical protein PHPALM_27997 [Phytophthora palmivora]|uniref:Uncharacterized protein n=1 Tax=Phytophthora palmivora TaxID=4796 RepID=A0A2P4XB98_9STRA|nr:LOW QUALITY PROTEIN: hypothetical protein PHPALM_27997 [Phytophthora palmivora]
MPITLGDASVSHPLKTRATFRSSWTVFVMRTPCLSWSCLTSHSRRSIVLQGGRHRSRAELHRDEMSERKVGCNSGWLGDPLDRGTGSHLDTDEFLSCPLLTLSIALVTQEAPCASLLGHLPALNPQAARLDSEQPQVESIVFGH